MRPVTADQRTTGLPRLPARPYDIRMASDNDNDPELEYSPLCGTVTRDGLTVRVQIYRMAGRSEGWTLEIVDHKGGSTVWDETFATDRVAYAEFFQTLENEGIQTFLDQQPTGKPH